jgi:hypothetical protein
VCVDQRDQHPEEQEGYPYHPGDDERAEGQRLELRDPRRQSTFEDGGLVEIDGAAPDAREGP